ncbi:CCN family member 5 isoform X1 [Onychostruthus taczanowskii]|uniref:CCN family member 5 isoform X1 n=1 Tax=Onychostruthus taczanowskii TaxID=356909 RepID=UPI001B8056F3|nr:CCN family member 5 isoform X1 [Onychostruthus taczanowskii]
MRLQLEKQLLFLSLLCILSKVCAQLCRRPCYCPWVPPRCPRGSPLVLDGCGCCKICARHLGEPCDFLHVCDQSQGLVCDYSSASAGTGGTCNFEDDEEGCEVNGRVYRDGEVFQPSCKIQCHCLDGGFNCIPLCQEDVRLPTPDCPFPRRVEMPGKCCPEWICEAQDQHLPRDARAEGKRKSFVAMPTPDSPWSQRLIPAKSLAQTHGTVVTVKMEGVSTGKTERKLWTSAAKEAGSREQDPCVTHHLPLLYTPLPQAGLLGSIPSSLG